jgi:outer membrane protein assembly factor BamD
VRRILRIAATCLLVALPASGLACKKKVEGVPKGRYIGMTAEELHQKGLELIEKRRFFRARAVLERALAQPGVSREQISEVSLAIADAFFRDGGIINLAEALSRYSSFLTFYPTHPRADYAQYQLGRSYLKQSLAPDKDQGTTKRALEAFRKVWLDFPDSEWIDEAQEQADACHERLAISEMKVGLFYKKRRAYPGAIDRFRVILEFYPRYSKRDRVYFELADALRAARKNDEALIYFQKIVEEYPESRYVGKARQALDLGPAPPERTAEAVEDPKSSRRKVSGAGTRSEGL